MEIHKNGIGQMGLGEASTSSKEKVGEIIAFNLIFAKFSFSQIPTVTGHVSQV